VAATAVGSVTAAGFTARRFAVVVALIGTGFASGPADPPPACARACERAPTPMSESEEEDVDSEPESDSEEEEESFGEAVNSLDRGVGWVSTM